MLSLVSLVFPVLAVDAKRGAEVLQDTHCGRCHKVMGEGGVESSLGAPDLADIFPRYLTAPAVAAALWNHTPAMWAAMNQETVARPKMTGPEAEDLFAYLYTLRYFDRGGEAQRGQDVVERKGCSGCHSQVTGAAGDAPALATWRVNDPMALARQMWNHSGIMKAKLANTQRAWISITGRDLSDIQAYVRQLQAGPSVKRVAASFSYQDDANGRALYESQCRTCHAGSLAPEKRRGSKTFLDIAAGMWNHSPRMAPIPILSDAEMTAVVSYVWRLQYMGEPGQSGRGRATFERKGCAGCHDSGERLLPRPDRNYTVFRFIAVAWEHGTLMQQAMKQKKIAWPALSAGDVSDITVYLNSRAQALPVQ